MKEYPGISEFRKKELIDFLQKYKKKGEINRKEIVKEKRTQDEYDFMHDWLESNNVVIIGKRVDEYEYREPLEEIELSEERKEYLIQYLKDNISKDRIPEYLLFQIQKDDNELDFMYNWLEDNDITLTGINSSLIGEIPDFKNIFRDGTSIDLPDYEPLSAKRKEQLSYAIKKIIKDKSVSNDELLKIAQDELEYLYMHDWLKNKKIEIKNIDSKHKNIKKGYKQVAYEEANKMDIELFKKMEAGDKEARNKIVEHNLRLASWVAHNHNTYFHAEEEDKLHYARIGLIKAVENFDYKKEYKFSTYAVIRMEWEIEKGLYKELLVKTPSHIIEKLKIIKNIEENFKENGITPTDVQIYENAPDFYSIDSIRELRAIEKLINQEGLNVINKKEDIETKISSLDDSQKAQVIDDELVDSENYFDDREEEIIDSLTSEVQEESIEEIVEKRELKSELYKVLSTLTDSEEKILRLRFGLDDGRSCTLEEVGQAYRVTRERVRQMEAKALRRLRHPRRADKIRNFCLDEGHRRFVSKDLRHKLKIFPVNNIEVINNEQTSQGDDSIASKQYFEGVNTNNIIDTMEIPDDEIIDRKSENKFEKEFEEEFEKEFEEKFEEEFEEILEQDDIQLLSKRVEEIITEIEIKNKELKEIIHSKELSKEKDEKVQELLKEKKYKLNELYNELEEINKKIQER